MYELLNIKWGDPTFGTPSGTINWQDNIGGLPTSSGSSTSGLVGALNNAFTAWEDVASIDFQEGGSLDLQIGFSSFSTDGIASNDGAAATAGWSTSGGSIEPVNATITYNSDLTWAPFGAGGINFYAVSLHEIGHIIGLDHVSDTSQIMHDTVFANDLGNGDIEGAQILYGTDPGDSPIISPSGGGRDGGDGGGGGAGGALGLLVGLLALIIGLFSGGAGAAVAVAAGHVDFGGDDESGEEDDDILVDSLPDEVLEVTHVTFLPEIPMVEFEIAAFTDDDDMEEAFFL